jgi:phage portal protein BeeE
MSSVDTQLIEQLKWTAETVCSTFHVPAYMVGVGAYPSYNNVQALTQQYYAQCLQALIESIELLLDEGLELKDRHGAEFDLDDLLRMDTATLINAEKEAVGAGIKKPNEARRRLNLSPVDGGETPYLQEQNWPLRLLSEREVPSREPTAPAPIAQPSEEERAVSKRRLKALISERLGHAAA